VKNDVGGGGTAAGGLKNVDGVAPNTGCGGKEGADWSRVLENNGGCTGIEEGLKNSTVEGVETGKYDEGYGCGTD